MSDSGCLLCGRLCHGTCDTGPLPQMTANAREIRLSGFDGKRVEMRTYHYKATDQELAQMAGQIQHSMGKMLRIDAERLFVQIRETVAYRNVSDRFGIDPREVNGMWRAATIEFKLDGSEGPPEIQSALYQVMMSTRLPVVDLNRLSFLTQWWICP